jgi:hypothetical protein
MGISSSTSAEFVSSRDDTNAYYEEMKSLFLFLRIFGLLPYHVKSDGELRFVSLT